ncbi:MAG: type III-B CRISPR module RAMP protein Cmr6 [Anaerolinea sp.]|nr:type III-B CRISPR module RAMP protein Cmr6 [Anaerolinea sp.]
MATYLVPQDAKVLVAGRVDKCANLSLLLARFVPEEAIYNKDNWSTEKFDKRKFRDGWLQERVCSQFNVKNNAPWQTLLESQFSRWKLMTTGAARFQARSLGRLIIGLGGKGPMEFGLTVQHVTGLPIIPGSALKGLTRAYALLTIAEKLGVPLLNAKELRELVEAESKPKSERKVRSKVELLDAVLAGVDEERERNVSDLQNEVSTFDLNQLNNLPDAQAYSVAFGSQDGAGGCIFYDALITGIKGLPPQGTLFEVDVMTPHFGDYYQEKAAPHDADSPVPVSFMTVAARTTFAFAVKPRSGYPETLVETVVKWTQSALSELGIGAKTAAGYGVFGEPSPLP